MRIEIEYDKCIHAMKSLLPVKCALDKRLRMWFYKRSKFQVHRRVFGDIKGLIKRSPHSNQGLL